MSSAPVFFHVDLDAFFASVEQMDNPGYKGKPVIVGAAPGHRGVVSACSYEARKFGVHSAMPISEAFRRCPQGIYLPVRMKRYAEVSGVVMGILGEFSPDVRPISIDEASLDMTGTSLLFGPPLGTAEKLKTQVRSRAGVPLSVGIAQNRFLAKMASDFKKPDGLYEVRPGGEEAFIDAVGLPKIWGLGKKTLERLSAIHLDTLAKLRQMGEDSLKSLMGQATGNFLYNAIRGRDIGMYSDTAKSHSISHETTFPEDTSDWEIISLSLLDLSHQVMYRLFAENGKSRTVSIKYRYSDFSTFSCQTTLNHLVASAEELYETGVKLLKAKWNPQVPLRLIGIGFDKVQPGEGSQQELFPTAYDRKGMVEKAVFNMQQKAGEATPVKASLLQRPRRGRR
ncbi:MAG: DNA polymerase IV [Spirochaetia bacterium]|jgi:DNA polymerase-4|nr:DNA polymerase IV [Spirochaetia bacterium]